MQSLLPSPTFHAGGFLAGIAFLFELPGFWILDRVLHSSVSELSDNPFRIILGTTNFVIWFVVVVSIWGVFKGLTLMLRIDDRSA